MKGKRRDLRGKRGQNEKFKGEEGGRMRKGGNEGRVEAE